MAAIGLSKISPLFTDGQADRVALYAMRDVTTGDTADLATEFASVKVAAVTGATVMAVEACPVSGTVVTIPAGLAADAGYLLAWGSSSGDADMRAG